MGRCQGALIPIGPPFPCSRLREPIKRAPNHRGAWQGDQPGKQDLANHPEGRPAGSSIRCQNRTRPRHGSSRRAAEQTRGRDEPSRWRDWRSNPCPWFMPVILWLIVSADAPCAQPPATAYGDGTATRLHRAPGQAAPAARPHLRRVVQAARETDDAGVRKWAASIACWQPMPKTAPP